MLKYRIIKTILLFQTILSVYSFYTPSSTTRNLIPSTSYNGFKNDYTTRPVVPLSLIKHHAYQQQKMTTDRRQSYTSMQKSTSTTLYLTPQLLGGSPYNILSLTDPIAIIPSITINTLLFYILRNNLSKKLTKEGMAHSLALGSMLCITLGWRGWFTCVLYLFLGSFVTKIKFQEKKDLGIEEKREGKRGPENVWGSALTALICASCASQGTSFLGISNKLYVLAFVTSLATKLSDTFASEIGKAYGKTTFLITTMEKVPPGTEGAVSLEGTIAALIGAILLPIYGSIAMLIPFTFNAIFISTISAFLATFAESWIGAAIQNKKGFEFMTNEVVNFVNTVIGAFLSISLGMILL